MAKTILLADDSVTIRKIVELTFGGTEIRVDAVGSGAEAMELFESGRPDVVLADVVMPEPSGYEICRAIKSSDRPVPVMLLAGAFEPYDEQLARECGADDHLVKPFESRTLMEKVDRLLHPPPPVEEPAPTPVPEPTEELPPDPAIDDEVEALASEIQESAPEALESQEADDEDLDDELLDRFEPEEIEAIARAVVRRLSSEVVREIVREVLPEVTDRLIRERIRELEGEE